MPKRKSDFELPKYDDLFSTQEERDDAKLDKIRDIPLELIDDFPDHPFHVRDDEDMQQLVDSIKSRGVLTPAVLREKEDGRYELVSGHRRSRDEAIIYMVESNFQRSSILPSEKAFSYKMRTEAIKRQAGRPKTENGVPVGHDSLTGKSREIIAAQSTDSNTQIQRYIRLTYLIPELLDLVDEGSIKMRPAVELSYLDEQFQRDVFEEIELNQCTPSHAQAIRLRKMQDEGILTAEAVSEVISEIKPNQKERIILRGEKIRRRTISARLLNTTTSFSAKSGQSVTADRRSIFLKIPFPTP